MLGVPFRLDSSFPGILPKLGKPFGGSLLGLRGRRLPFKTSMALCASQTWKLDQHLALPYNSYPLRASMLLKIS
jgi:hypothetical protein